jgi:hyperosmotically inducible protein
MEHFRSSRRIDMSASKMKHLLLLGVVASACAGTITTVQAAGQDRGMQRKESVQPGSDTWITTKVKAELLATKDVSGLDIKVETVNGVVSLSGDVDTQAEVDRAVATARKVDGVTRVDNRLVVRGAK